ncbi:MAG: DNA translocase FtsK 4TM domain-containing protein [Limnobacter sp.]|uniref:DNA translocase FtsK n=1 Tax=Limnobacter sp. TaxID=2003368 RepID=UPI0022BB130C|nr:DNA translocase FtsK [Limnobacter sp.]MCZ8015350.1 DNA translocase FtsK 4TM domain-containing protein [Limnobacter sp.]
MNSRTTQNAGTLRISKLLLEIRWMCLLVFSIYLFLILVSHSGADDSFSHESGNSAVRNFGGAVGAHLSDLLFFISGYSAYALLGLSFFMLWRARRMVDAIDLPGFNEPLPKWIAWVRPIGFMVLWLGLMGLESLSIFKGTALPAGAGGVVGQTISGVFQQLLGLSGAVMLLLLCTAAGLSGLLGLSWAVMAERVGAGIENLLFKGQELVSAYFDRKEGKKVALARVEKVEQKREKFEEHKPIRIEPVAVAAEPSVQAIKEKQQPLFAELTETELPPLGLLDDAPAAIETVSADTLEYTSRLIEKKLSDFGVQVQVVAAQPGPVITRFEVEPAAGVKGSQVVNLAKDLARALSLVSIRVVETIYGKNLMGLELPNPRRQVVKLTEILGSQVYSGNKSPVTMALGKDIAGKPVVADLAKMPHLLVAGTTGSGKSVGINAMILSLLYKSGAEDVRLILIDPKMLEMSVYEGIPHLLCPVVTDMRQAANALNWAVGEMEKRYRLMSKMGVRNLAGYNVKIAEAKKNGQSIPNPFSLTPDAPEPLDTLPMLVIVIDELADLMMVVGKKIEELIARLAQKARAAGIHLILATQRPSVDVITGLIKANIPTRIAFQVSSKIDSRTILDQMGAEALLGQGDMLFLPPGSGVPQRVHGAFVSDEEVHRVVEYLKEKGGEPNYIEGILEGGTAEEGGNASMDATAGSFDGEKDALYDQAVGIVLKHRRASISFVQRHLRIGYNRAARLLESMEQAGLVSAMQSNGNREILARAEAGQDEE